MPFKDIKDTQNIQRNIKKHVVTHTSIIIVLPVVCAVTENLLWHTTADCELFGKWFLFWCFGFRLFITGIKQASDPSFIIKNTSTGRKEFYEIMRELGIANICLGVGGILSLINETWRQVIALLGCLFFGLAVMRHLTSRISSKQEKFIMIENDIIFLILILYVMCTLKRF